MTPGSLPARTQHLGKVPTDASTFLPAQVGGGAPPAARPLGAGIAAARALPRAHPYQRLRGDSRPGTRATPRGLRSRPLAPAARPPSAEVRPGPRDSGQIQPPATGRPALRPRPATHLHASRRSRRNSFPRAELPAAERNPGQGRAGQGGVRAPHRSRPPARVLGSREEQPARTGPPRSCPASSPPPLPGPLRSWQEGFRLGASGCRACPVRGGAGSASRATPVRSSGCSRRPGGGDRGRSTGDPAESRRTASRGTCTRGVEGGV